MLRRTSLRTRLVTGIGLLAGCAVLAGSLASYAVVRGELSRQIDDSLLASVPPPLLDPRTLCRSVPPPNSIGYRMQIRVVVVGADGSVCTPDPTLAVPTSPDDVRTARTGRGGGFRSATVNGVHLRIRVYPIPARSGFSPRAAVVAARPLTETDAALEKLAVFLVVATLLTLAGVSVLAVLLARRLLGPVGQLTAAAEHIARTEDLAVPIVTHGRDEVARLAAAFNAMIDRLSRARQRQQQLVVDAGHELRTPLTSLRTNAELLTRSEDAARPLESEARRRIYANITAQSTELAALVEELTILASDRLSDPAAEPVCLDDVVARAVDRARPRAGDRDLVVGPPSGCHVMADAAALERAILNLLDNAVKFNPPEGVVRIRQVVDGLTVTVEVVDDGPGIDPAHLPHVFDRFWRAPGSRSLPGSGLGLAIVHETAAAHGGRIRLARAENGGTVARLTLPTIGSSPADHHPGGRDREVPAAGPSPGTYPGRSDVAAVRHDDGSGARSLT